MLSDTLTASISIDEIDDGNDLFRKVINVLWKNIPELPNYRSLREMEHLFPRLVVLETSTELPIAFHQVSLTQHLKPACISNVLF